MRGGNNLTELERLRRPSIGCRAESGFTYIGLLIAVAIIGLLLTVVGQVWKTTAQRERETQLLWVGQQYRLAIASYYANGRGFPSALADLVQDERFPVPKHHLRRLYPDPMTGQADWTPVLTPDGQAIMGIASSSNGVPIKRKGFDVNDAIFEDADCYCAWQFVYMPRRRWGVTPGVTPTGPTAPSDPANPTNSFDPGHLGPLNPSLAPNGGLVAPGVTVPRTSSPD
jgi:type II secretory pathway pseudopilin PulG